MPTEIFVRSKSETLKWLYDPKLTKLDWAVTMLDPGERMPIITGNPVTHLRMGFEDVNDATRPFAPTMADCKAVLDFADRSVKEGSVGIIHCYAGMSRSTCTALAFQVHVNKFTMEEAHDWIMIERKIAIPNPLMAKYYDQLLGLNGKFAEMCEVVANTNRARMIIDVNKYRF